MVYGFLDGAVQEGSGFEQNGSFKHIRNPFIRQNPKPQVLNVNGAKMIYAQSCQVFDVKSNNNGRSAGTIFRTSAWGFGKN